LRNLQCRENIAKQRWSGGSLKGYFAIHFDSHKDENLFFKFLHGYFEPGSDTREMVAVYLERSREPTGHDRVEIKRSGVLK
jgi:hypothetical protein